MKWLTLFFFVCLLVSCAQKYDCRTSSVIRWEPGYDSAKTAIIIIRDYERTPGTPFSKLLYTTVSGSSVHSSVPGPNADTVLWSEDVTRINLSHDITMELPAINRTYKLRDFSVQQNHGRTSGLSGGAEGCANTVRYYLDDVLYEKTPNAAGMNFPPPVIIILD